MVEVVEGRGVGCELREKISHSHFQTSHGHEEHSDQPHDFSPVSHSRQASMLGAIEDCELVVCGGIGQAALMSIQSGGNEIGLTDVCDVQTSSVRCLADDLPHQIELSH